MRMRWRTAAKRLYREWRSNVLVWLFNVFGGGSMIVAAWHIAVREFHRSPVEWYLVAILVVIGIALLIAGVVFSARNRPPAIAVNGDPVLGDYPQKQLFSPLQIEAFRLARDIRQFHSNFEPIPPTNLPFTGTDAQRLEAIRPRIEWRKKLDSAYKLNFEDRQRQLELKFGAAGISVNRPTGYSSGGNEVAIPLYVSAIVAAAHRLDGILLVDPRTRQ